MEGLADDVRLVVVEAGFTNCVKAVSVVLPLKMPSLLYWAVMEWEPTASEDVVKVAWPDASVPVPMPVAPSENVTVPVGVGARSHAALTVAVKVTDCPNTEGFADELNTVFVI